MSSIFRLSPQHFSRAPQFGSIFLVEQQAKTTGDSLRSDQAQTYRVVLEDDDRPYVFYQEKSGPSISREMNSHLGLINPIQASNIQSIIRAGKEIVGQLGIPAHLSPEVKDSLPKGQLEYLFKKLQNLFDQVHTAGYIPGDSSERGLAFLSALSHKNYITHPNTSPFTWEIMTSPPKFQDVIIHALPEPNMDLGVHKQMVLDIVV